MIVFKGNGCVWNGTRKNIIKFVDGTYATDKPSEIERLKDYPTIPPGAVEEYYSKKTDIVVEVTAEKTIDDYNIKELKEYAKERDINLHGKTTKADILEIIKGE